MMRTFISPSRYYQGPGILKRLGEFSAQYGKKALILISKNGIGRFGDLIQASFAESEATYQLEAFNGESSQKEIDRVIGVGKDIGADLVVGIGGGKIFDTAKAAAHGLNVPVIIAPTVAASDAPCSALAVIYTEDGAVDHYLYLPANPNLVLMDSAIIAKSPTRFTVSGMGDALATYVEARASYKHDGDNLAGLSAGGSLHVGQAVAKLCYQLLMENGVKAKTALDAGTLTPAVEAVIEANTLLSGLGFESGGVAASHAVHNGFSVLPECHHSLHGEKVAFGIITQLVLENAPTEELNSILDFCVSVGLPVTMAQIGVTDPTPEKIMRVATLACSPNDTGVNMPFAIDPDMVYNAIFAADAFGKIALAKKA
jgi:glycerol dehydrogenase